LETSLYCSKSLSSRDERGDRPRNDHVDLNTQAGR